MKYYLFILLIISPIFLSCENDFFNWNLPQKIIQGEEIRDSTGFQVPNNSAPVVFTGSATLISESGATVSGEISSIGSSKITSYGHCWSLNALPTIDDFKTNLGSSSTAGVFSSFITSLLPNREYFVRSYSTNSFGTSYGSQIRFRTRKIICNYLNCESLDGFTTFVDKIRPSDKSSWFIGQGKVGNGFILNEPSYGGSIEFSINNTQSTKLRFWTKSLNVGFPNLIPVVTIDGRPTNLLIVDGSQEYSKWMQLESQIILSGRHTVKINFVRNSSFFSYYIDEIEFYCE